MAIPFLNDIDLSKNELQNAIIQNVGSNPSNLEAGQIWFNSTDHYLYYFNGTASIPVGYVNFETNSSNIKVAGTASVGSLNTVPRADHVHPAQTSVSGNAGTATTLQTGRYLDGILFNGSANITHFLTCSSDASSTVKSVMVNGQFSLVTGATVFVQFTKTNTAATNNLQLRVDSNGGQGTAKNIRYRNGYLPAVGTLAEDRIYIFVYDGTDWELVGDLDTEYSAGTSANITNSDTTAKVWTGKILHDYIAAASVNYATSSGSATKMATKRGIDGVLFDGTESIGHFVTVDTTGSAYSFSVTYPGFMLYEGSWIAIKFAGSGSSSDTALALNINQQGAKNVKYYNDNNAIPASAYIFRDNRVYLLVYDGTDFRIVGDLDTHASYDSGTLAQLRAGTITQDEVWTPKILHDYVAEAIGAANAMRFKGTVGTGGTVTTLPTTGVQVGDTYMVSTAGTYAGQVCEVGDLIIATATTPTWTVAQTNINGAITSITGTSPITVSGSGASRTVAHENSGVTAASRGETTNKTPGFGDSFYVTSGTVNATGHLTAFNQYSVTIPATIANQSSPGLMSAADKTKLNASTRMETFGNPALTSTNGICTWTLTTANIEYGQVMIYEQSTGKQVMAEVVYDMTTTNKWTIKFISSTNITGNTYEAVVIGL